MGYYSVTQINKLKDIRRFIIMEKQFNRKTKLKNNSIYCYCKDEYELIKTLYYYENKIEKLLKENEKIRKQLLDILDYINEK